jgi:hypothetical protein
VPQGARLDPELFTMNPQEIPIGAEHGTQLFSFDSAYR